MVDAATFLYLRRNQLAHADERSQSSEFLRTSYYYATQLLASFGTFAQSALKNMEALGLQYADHLRFKHDRISKMGWREEDSSSTLAVADMDDTVDQCLDYQRLKVILLVMQLS